MANPKRRAVERARDLALIAEYHLDGLDQQAIADKLNVRDGVPYTISARTVSHDLKAVRERYTERANIATTVRIGEQVAMLRKRRATYYGAWVRSQEDAAKQRNVEGGDGDTSKTTEVEKRTGDIAFLRGVERAESDLADLFALNAPTKIAITDASGHKDAAVTNEATAGVLADLVRQMGYLVDDEPCPEKSDDPT